MIKLIVNKTSSSNGNVLRQGVEAKPLSGSFVFHFQELSANLYVLRANDCAHELSCEMPVELKEVFASLEEEGEEGGYFAPAVFASFPAISLEKLSQKVGFDSYLQGILMHQFQLNILEQLLLFCEEKGAVKLILTASDAELDDLEIYSRFFVSEKRVVTTKGEQTQVTIPTDVHTYDEIVDFMDELDKDFRKILWREQNANPAFRNYLKLNS